MVNYIIPKIFAKQLLLKGYSFNGHSDTEVLLTSYIEWKEKCVNYLNGIFAFAIWDERGTKIVYWTRSIRGKTIVLLRK